MILFPGCDITEAKKLVSEWNNLTDEEFSRLEKRWRGYDCPQNDNDNHFAGLREAVAESFKAAKTKTLSDSQLDVRVGIALYLKLNELGFTVADASNDDIWRYITLKIFPDITYIRYPEPGKNDIRINSKRFYSHTRRIWLKTLWWYVYLSWQGTAEETEKILWENGTNIISHFIERVGIGYRVHLYRSFMAIYSQQPNKGDTLFRAAAKINRAKCLTIEPELCENGVEGYVTDLFSSINQNVNRNGDSYD